MTTVAEKWAQVLNDLGVRYVFGNPSGPWMVYMEALRNKEIQFVLVSNEASAGFMADGSPVSPASATVRLVLGQRT